MSLAGNEDLRHFIDQLTATTNVAKYVELPMIAVMGDTSSGKSSLLSSISAIELPSSSELTTRCPIMLQMRRADEKSASVDIVLKNNHDSTPAHEFEPKSITEENWATLPSVISEAQKYVFVRKLHGK